MKNGQIMTAQSGGVFITTFKWDSRVYFCQLSSRKQSPPLLKIVSMIFLLVFTACGRDESKNDEPEIPPSIQWFDSKGYVEAIRLSINQCKTRGFERFGNLFGRDIAFDKSDVTTIVAGFWQAYFDGVQLSLERTVPNRAEVDVKISEIGDFDANYLERGIECDIPIEYSTEIDSLEISYYETFID